jgi:putative two-component system response regulator
MLHSHEDRRPRLLLVDDEPTNLHVLRQILGDTYRLQFATDGAKALHLVQQQKPDLILLDIMMPQLSGYDVCRQLKADPHTSSIPVIFVSALSEMGDEAEGFEVGAVDYIIKPVRAPVVRARVRTHLSLVAADALRATRLHIIQRLGRAAEYKDNETGMHVLRMSHFAQALAIAIGCSEMWADDLLHAAPMHDVGKIGIPDAVLLKPGPLSDSEWHTMRLHPAIGAEIIGDHDSPILQMARSISLTHHEKWDGSGYPAGLRGEDIPLAARIVALADVFDALTSERPYKRAWSIDDALAHICAQAGKHFDPELVPVFVGLRPHLEAIRARWKDEAAPATLSHSLG